MQLKASWVFLVSHAFLNRASYLAVFDVRRGGCMASVPVRLRVELLVDLVWTVVNRAVKTTAEITNTLKMALLYVWERFVKHFISTPDTILPERYSPTISIASLLSSA